MDKKTSLSLEDAITHTQQIAENTDCDAYTCAYHHDLLVDWLNELKRYRATGLSPEQIANGAVAETAYWQVSIIPNTFDTYGNPSKIVHCTHCGFHWTDLYAVRTYFKCCPGCGFVMTMRD